MQVSNRAVDLVEEGFDVALRVRGSLDDSGSMVLKSFGESNALLVASPSQLERQGRQQQPQKLEHFDTVAMASANGRTTWHLMGPSGAQIAVQHTPRLVADDLLTLRLAVLQGVGIGWMPDYLCHDEIKRGALVHVLAGWAPVRGIVHAIFPSRRGLVPAVRLFLDFLGENLRGEGLSMPG